jgi:hypothetical protein
MNRKAVVRHVTLGAVVTGLVPLTAAGAGAGPAGGSAAALCRSAFGERGPAGGPVVGEGPSGDPMSVSLGWEPADWPDGLRQIVTCVSVDGHGVPALTTVTDAPSNTGSLGLDLMLPSGEPGSLVCERSVLVGSGSEGRTRPTSPVCFKLRAADPPPPTKAGGRASDGAPAPGGTAPGPRTPNGPGAPAVGSGPNAPAGPPARTPNVAPGPVGRRAANAHAPLPNGPAGPPAPVPTGQPAPGARNRMGSPDPASTPPARAAFEAAAGAASPRSRLATVATPPAAPATAPATLTGRPAGAPVTALPRTGLDNHIPLAGAGGLLALGGAFVVLAEPRRRAARLRPGT